MTDASHPLFISGLTLVAAPTTVSCARLFTHYTLPN